MGNDKPVWSRDAARRLASQMDDVESVMDLNSLSFSENKMLWIQSMYI